MHHFRHTPSAGRIATAVLAFGLFIVLFDGCYEEPCVGVRSQPFSGRLEGFSYPEQRFEMCSLAASLAARVGAPRGVWKSQKGASLSHRLEEVRRRAALHLLTDRPAKAVELLEEGLTLAPDDAALINDLTVARIDLGEQEDEPYEFVLASIAAERSRRLAPDSRSARFNYALALSLLSVESQALSAWQDVLALEGESDWVQEATENSGSLVSDRMSRERLLNALAETSEDSKNLDHWIGLAPRVYREHAEEVLMEGWGRALSEDRLDDGRILLDRARVIGESLQKNSGDSTLASSIAQIDQLQVADPKALSRVASGLQDYGRGLRLTQGMSYEAALPYFIRAEMQLAEARSPFAGWAKYRIALCHYQQYEYAEARRWLRSVFAGSSLSEDLALQGRARILSGLMSSIEGDPIAALQDYRLALSVFEKNGEAKYRSKVMALLANGYDALGQPRKAWRWLHSALATSGIADEPAARLTPFNTAAWLAVREREFRLARFFQNEYLSLASAASIEFAIIDALRGRAEIRYQLGSIEGASRDLEEARERLGALEDSELGLGLAGDIKLIEAERLEARPQLALRALDETLAVYESTNYTYSWIRALHRRAEVLIGLGRFHEAESDLEQAILSSEQQRNWILEARDRVSFFDQMRSLLDTMIQLQVHHLQDPRAGLEYSERAKARVLKDWIDVHPAEPTTSLGIPEILDTSSFINELESSIPESTVVIEYTLLAEESLVWVLKNDKPIQVAPIPRGAEELARWVDGLRVALESEDSDAATELETRLYDALLSPIDHLFEEQDRLVFVPDGALHSLPFSILRNPGTNKLLLHDHITSVVPSLNMFLNCTSYPSGPRVTDELRLMVVLSPNHDRRQHPEQRLPFGESELNLARLFEHSETLVGDDATPGAFIDKARHFDLIHFGGHSVLNPAYPLNSFLLFAPDETYPSGALYSSNLLQETLSNVQLVVLASCDAGSGRLSSTEGVESLARTFLASGVSGVIASPWPVDNASTARFFSMFYEHLLNEGDAALALRLTRQALLARDGKERRTVGSFVLSGCGRVGQGISAVD